MSHYKRIENDNILSKFEICPTVEKLHTLQVE